jgi:hypothetical protein
MNVMPIKSLVLNSIMEPMFVMVNKPPKKRSKQQIKK